MSSIRVALAVVIAFAACGSALAGRPLPAVRVVTLAPLEVKGAHFAAKEKVQLTLRAGKATLRRTATSSSDGTFSASFGTLTASERCAGTLTLSARGARRDSANYSVTQQGCGSTSSGVGATYSTS